MWAMQGKEVAVSTGYGRQVVGESRIQCLL